MSALAAAATATAVAQARQSAQRHRAIRLYKELLHLGREYPDPSYNFAGRMRALYERNRNLTDPEEIDRALALGEFIRNETVSLYSLRKYRHMKRSYYNQEEAQPEPASPTPTPTPRQQ